MSKFVSRLKKEPFSLIVALPQASITFAEAAEKAGADAVCVNFDSSQDKNEIIDIVRAVNIPAGIIFSREDPVSLTQVAGLIKLGFDFFDVPAGLIGNLFPSPSEDGRIARLSPDFALESLMKMSAERTDAIDAAIIDPALFGKELTVGDLQQYISICVTSPVPVIVPAQKAVRISEVPIILDAGAKALMIDKAITGDSLNTFRTVVSQFKSAVLSVKENK